MKDREPEGRQGGVDPMERLLRVMARLRDPERGCPWDVEQDFESIAPYTIEEAYEVADAIERRSMEDLKGELGDLLFQVVFHARMAEELDAFDFEDVADHISEKMIERHPHVFGEGAGIDSAGAQTRNWEAQKAAERGRRAAREGRRPSALDGVAMGLPALMRAEKIQKRAARVGFDFPDIAPVMGKIDEEWAEVRAEIESGDRDRQEAEIGDLLFAVVNLARYLGIDAEAALRNTNSRFVSRFHRVEAAVAAEGRSIEEATLEEMDAHWNAAKKTQD
ncbi:MAG: nucleoside triphosphate pyrophosphohydrolase [Rhizobiales bacterium NRL2]|jgi:MazG family protein|nr:MAG: nucleoside triphosphate pyrophosphohydrolase [Rhizobiales bacterium NRL2]